MLPRAILFGVKAFIIQWKSPQELKKFQEKRLRHIVRYAYENSAFYRKKFKEHLITPDDICRLGDLQKIPTLTKTELRENFSQVISNRASKETCVVETTSGSTGEKVTLLQDHRATDYYAPVHLRGHVAVGLKPHHKTVYIRYKQMKTTLVEDLGLFKFYHISSDLPLDTIIQELKKIKPFAINCYPTTMYLLARTISAADAAFLSPHHIVTWSEKLTPKIRKTVEETFDCPVYDQYGAFECHSMAFECPEKKMHINADVLIMEFVKDGESVSPGERGDIIVTNLWNRAMPFIRYEIGDIGIPSDEVCPCGRGLPVMEGLEGRTDDFLVTLSGDIVLPSRVVPLFFPYEGIDIFQVVQQKKDEIVVKIVKNEFYGKDTDRTLVGKFKRIFGEKVEIRIEHVEKIEKMPGGKLRSIVCEVSP
jgi:phenylacetate-CoA ligase